jgi:hypothetical protein
LTVAGIKSAATVLVIGSKRAIVVLGPDTNSNPIDPSEVDAFG